MNYYIVMIKLNVNFIIFSHLFVLKMLIPYICNKMVLQSCISEHNELILTSEASCLNNKELTARLVAR